MRFQKLFIAEAVSNIDKKDERLPSIYAFMNCHYNCPIKYILNMINAQLQHREA
jgi:hypothetical protein